MFVAKAVGQAIINTHTLPQWHNSFSAFRLMMHIDISNNFSQNTLKSKLPRCDFRAVPLVPMAGAGLKRPSCVIWRFERCPHWPMMIQKAHDDSYVYSELNMLLFEVLPFKDKSEWGRCSDNCPLTGPQKANLGKVVTWEFA